MDRNGIEEGGQHQAGRCRLLAEVAAGIIAGAALVYSAACVTVALTLSRPRRVPFDETPDLYGLDFEPVLFRSRVDRIRLDGWLIHPPAETRSRSPVIMVHGMGADRQHEAGGCALQIAAHLAQDGHPVLMFDLRGSGRSGGRRFTLGAEEVRDVGGAIDYLAGRGLAPRGVNLLGYSMGAATALLAGAADPLVRAVAADSGYAELDDLLQRQLPKMSGLPTFATPGVVLAGRSLLGIDLRSIRPIHAAGPRLAARGVPLLLLHGEGDSIVPIDHGRRIARAYGQGAETLFVPGAEHVVSYAVAPTAYLEKLTSFLARGE